ncbi:hypothetical protein [Microbacterium sp. NPDC086615]|uniref:hypothetical protein n=1 Tax=Microbacterium sp. NPDC086615 TaxID=3154865 RepID=UPI003416176B
MGLGEAMDRIREQSSTQAEAEVRQAAADAVVLADIRKRIDTLATAASDWLRANPRPKSGLSFVTVAPTSDWSWPYGIVHEVGGWMLGEFFLSDDGMLSAYTPTTWFPQSYSPPEGWEVFVSEAAAELGVRDIHPSRTWSRNELDGPRYERIALTPLQPVIRPASTEYTNDAEIYLEGDHLHSSGSYGRLEDKIAGALLALR